MRRDVVEIEPIVLRVLAVIAFRTGQAERSLLEKSILAIPQRERETQALSLVADTEQPVLVPPVGATARVVVREILSGVAAGAIVLANGSPCALGEVRTPESPG